MITSLLSSFASRDDDDDGARRIDDDTTDVSDDCMACELSTRRTARRKRLQASIAATDR